MNNNFECSWCKEQFYISRYKTFADNVFKDQNGRVLVCRNCDGSLVPIEHNEFKGFPDLGRFKMKSVLDRQADLKERSKRHAKTLKEEVHFKEQNNLY